MTIPRPRGRTSVLHEHELTLTPPRSSLASRGSRPPQLAGGLEMRGCAAPDPPPSKRSLGWHSPPLSPWLLACYQVFASIALFAVSCSKCHCAWSLCHHFAMPVLPTTRQPCAAEAPCAPTTWSRASCARLQESHQSATVAVRFLVSKTFIVIFDNFCLRRLAANTWLCDFRSTLP